MPPYCIRTQRTLIYRFERAVQRRKVETKTEREKGEFLTMQWYHNLYFG